MKVFKFGGASVSSIERIKNVSEILKTHQHEPLMVIISAMGKTTNALEKVAAAFYAGKQEEALQLFELVKQNHLTTAKYLLVTSYNHTLNELVNYFTEVEWLLHDKPVRDFDYYYDQVVCIGELLSTCIVSAYLNEAGIPIQLLDVRDILRTDNTFRDAAVDWTETERLLKEQLPQIRPLITTDHSTGFFSVGVRRQHGRMTADDGANKVKEALQLADKQGGNGVVVVPQLYITQGFIGSTSDNESTTLGREGSDYSAAIFANLLQAQSLTIWEDVEGVMSADPKAFSDAVFLEELSYNEVIEMAYYGAQVIHPKTIKPLQNKHIPLYVKSFINPGNAGTIIGSKNGKNLPPIKVIKQQQVLVYLHSLDFSFVGEQPLMQLYSICEGLHLKPNLIQTGAISIQLCVDEKDDKIGRLAELASALFDVQLEKGLTLLTIRHYNNPLIEEMTAGKEILLMQKTTGTVQVLYR